jgi:hypothetical protein
LYHITLKRPFPSIQKQGQESKSRCPDLVSRSASCSRAWTIGSNSTHQP